MDEKKDDAAKYANDKIVSLRSGDKVNIHQHIK